jgi:hypothetical protein
MAIHLASAKGTPQPGESEAHPTAAWVQVLRIGIFAAGCRISRVTSDILSPSSLRRFHNRHSGLACSGHAGNSHREALTWVFNIFGTADLLFAFYLGARVSLPDTPGLLGAGYFILMAYVPLLLITHGLAFRILLGTKAVAPSPRKVRMA